MKRVFLAGAVAAALTLTALSHQRAAAQSCPPSCQRGGEVTFTTGLTLGFHCSPKCGHWEPNCYGPPPYGYPQGCPGAKLPNPPEDPAGAPKAVPVPAPAPTSANAAAAGVQNVGYTYPTPYGYGYWYGYPYYQAPAYGYGR